MHRYQDFSPMDNCPHPIKIGGAINSGLVANCHPPVQSDRVSLQKFSLYQVQSHKNAHLLVPKNSIKTISLLFAVRCILLKRVLCVINATLSDLQFTIDMTIVVQHQIYLEGVSEGGIRILQRFESQIFSKIDKTS
jgi:hypothetical protein